MFWISAFSFTEICFYTSIRSVTSVQNVNTFDIADRGSGETALFALLVVFDAFHVLPAAASREVSTYACIFPQRSQPIDGAASACCQDLQCHKRVLNQSCYEVCVMAQSEQRDVVQLVLCPPLWCCGAYWSPGAHTDRLRSKAAASANSLPARTGKQTSGRRNEQAWEMCSWSVVLNLGTLRKKKKKTQAKSFPGCCHLYQNVGVFMQTECCEKWNGPKRFRIASCSASFLWRSKDISSPSWFWKLSRRKEKKKEAHNKRQIFPSSHKLPVFQVPEQDLAAGKGRCPDMFSSQHSGKCGCWVKEPWPGTAVDAFSINQWKTSFIKKNNSQKCRYLEKSEGEESFLSFKFKVDHVDSFYSQLSEVRADWKMKTMEIVFTKFFTLFLTHLLTEKNTFPVWWSCQDCSIHANLFSSSWDHCHSHSWKEIDELLNPYTNQTGFLFLELAETDGQEWRLAAGTEKVKGPWRHSWISVRKGKCFTGHIDTFKDLAARLKCHRSAVAGSLSGLGFDYLLNCNPGFPQ